MNVEEKERLIKKDIATIENKVRHAFNQGYEIGVKESKEPCGDAISRQAVLDIINNPLNIRLDKIIEKLPSVTPQQRTGRWIIIDDCEQFIAKCSECGRIEDSRMISKYSYCHCGAKMGGEQNGSN